jgi:hypothetical protein
MSKQTALDLYEKEINFLIKRYESKEISKREFITMKHNLFYNAKEMEKEQSQNYAIFAIRCDRTEMRILEFNDYIKLEENLNK